MESVILACHSLPTVLLELTLVVPNVKKDMVFLELEPVLSVLSKDVSIVVM